MVCRAPRRVSIDVVGRPGGNREELVAPPICLGADRAGVSHGDRDLSGDWSRDSVCGVADLLRELARNPAIAGTDPTWLAEATRVYPALKSVLPGIPEPPPAPAEAIRLRLADALVNIVDAVSDNGPVFIGLDDVQHMDPASRDVLHLLTRRWSVSPVLLIGTWRSPGHHSETTPTALEWQNNIELRPLGDLHITEIVAGSELPQRPDAKILQQLAFLSQGNPYFAEMLLSDWQDHQNESLTAQSLAGERLDLRTRPVAIRFDLHLPDYLKGSPEPRALSWISSRLQVVRSLLAIWFNLSASIRR